ncbi:MAG: hypothetical protein ACE5F6_21275, partial [Anaerolineae bacterium]
PSPGGFMSSPLHMSAPSVGGALPTLSGATGNLVKRLGLAAGTQLIGHMNQAHWMIGDSVQGCAA